MGGAGFASQFSAIDAAPQQNSTNIEGNEEQNDSRERYWDLSPFDGIELDVEGDDRDRTYTFILRDEVEREKRDDGREQAGISWEVRFKVVSETRNGIVTPVTTRNTVWLAWDSFKATYRGSENEEPERLKV